MGLDNRNRESSLWAYDQGVIDESSELFFDFCALNGACNRRTTLPAQEIPQIHISRARMQQDQRNAVIHFRKCTQKQGNAYMMIRSQQTTGNISCSGNILHSLSVEEKVRIFNSDVKSVLSYGSET